MSEKGKSWYLHTIDGHPAYFDTKHRRLFMLVRVNRSTTARVLIDSLAELRKQQEIHKAIHAVEGNDPGRTGYVSFSRELAV